LVSLATPKAAVVGVVALLGSGLGGSLVSSFLEGGDLGDNPTGEKLLVGGELLNGVGKAVSGDTPKEGVLVVVDSMGLIWGVVAVFDVILNGDWLILGTAVAPSDGRKVDDGETPNEGVVGRVLIDWKLELDGAIASGGFLPNGEKFFFVGRFKRVLSSSLILSGPL
jgi:hypothetical protein